MMDLDALADRVRNAIPLTRHLAFDFESFDGLQLVVSAPLGPNHNDKGTFFAGSQSALLTLAGWGLTTLLAQQAGHPADVVAVETGLEYTLPLHGDLRITATVDPHTRERFEERLTRRGKAPLKLTAQGTDPQGQTVCRFHALYLART
ncbi:MAG: thioesterase domain-containing protein [Pseudomonadales bacterium]|nr:thioesterase domain-containing protein [Pseudomonadales bacterium]